MRSIRDLVHQTLSLIGVPASVKDIRAVHQAFFGSDLPASRLGSLRRDEERSYTATNSARPYYVCPALTADRFAPARGVLSLSTWPLEERIVVATSSRVNFLAMTVGIADAAERLAPAARSAALNELLYRLALDVLGAAAVLTDQSPDLDLIRSAAQDELKASVFADRQARAEAAGRARQLEQVHQYFGTR